MLIQTFHLVISLNFDWTICTGRRSARSHALVIYFSRGSLFNQVMMMLEGEIIYVLTFLIGLFLRVGVWLLSWFYITIWFHLCINVFMSENHGPR